MNEPQEVTMSTIKPKKHTITHDKWPLLKMIFVLSLAGNVGAQYGMISQGYGDSKTGYDFSAGEADERPRLHLGIKLRIPAFKVDLPRFNMPKITVSAKIRQPDRPRTITLPEINLDTSSKLSAPGSGGDVITRGQANSYKSSNYQPAYQSTGERTQSFTFSTDGESHPPEKKYYGHQVQQQQMSYAASINNPAHYQPKQTTSSNNLYDEATNSDIGFNQPVYLEPQAADTRPIHEYLISPMKQVGFAEANSQTNRSVRSQAHRESASVDLYNRPEQGRNRRSKHLSIFPFKSWW